jgi:uncharacterized BrkB/YihY/UPF0761 family membrane protein
MQRRYEALKARGDALQERAQNERSRHATVDAVFQMVDRDAEVGGGIIAGAIAYRLFIWLLPFAFVLVGGLGVTAEASSSSPEDVAGTLGLSGLVTNSIASAASGQGRWYALLIGIPLLFWATRSLLRVMIGAHRLAWTDARGRAHKPTMRATAVFLALLLLYYVIAGVTVYARTQSDGLGLIVTLLVAVAYAGVWLLVSNRLPHTTATWTALLPGALIVGMGVEILNVVSVYILAPWAQGKQGTYGVLGLASAILFGLFLIARLIVGAAIVNATLWERGAHAGRAAAPPPPSGA